MVNRLDYDTGVPAENIEQYVPGGLHPIHLNDRLGNGRYEIIHKLGFGAFSTVWLARDHENHTHVSIKVVEAKRSEKQDHELKTLQTLKEKSNQDHPGYKHVSHLLDSFYHTGPNGRHLCVVLELLGPKASSVAEASQDYRLNGNLARRISRQLLLAVDYLHSCGIAHGDIHMGNILFRLSDTLRSSSERIIETFGPPSIGKLSRRDGAPIEEGLPEYLVEPVEFANISPELLDEVQLIDFGESFFTRSPPSKVNTPMSLHAPELVFHRPLSEAIDMWNLGSTTYELVLGRAPFEADFGDNDQALIPQFRKVLGDLPGQWIDDALTSGLLQDIPDDEAAEGFLSLEAEIRRTYSDGHEGETLPLSAMDLEQLGRYLRRVLVAEPDRRATSGDLLSDPWVAVTTPETDVEKRGGGSV